jgi:acyl-CoA thioesterase-1
MRILWSVIALTCVSALACAGGDASKDTPSDSAPSGALPIPAAKSETTSDSSGAPGASASGVSGPNVLFVGTSLTAGLGLDPSKAYPAVLQRMADSAGYAVHIVNAGLSGETSAGALRRLDWLLREPASMVVLETGANDGLRGLDVDSTRANLVAIVQLVKRTLPDAEIFLVQMEAPPNLGADYTRRFHDNYAAVAKEEGITLLPFLLNGVAGVRRLNQGDGIHPTEAGAVIVARNLWGSLAPGLSRLAKAPKPG